MAGGTSSAAPEHTTESDVPSPCIFSLPNEVIESIICMCDLETICALAQTCQRFNDVQLSITVWKSAFHRRYPRLAADCHEEPLRGQLTSCGDSWRQLTRRRWQLGVSVRWLLDSLGSRYYPVGGLPDPAVQDLQQLVTCDNLALVRDELLDVLEAAASHPFENLSRCYYARMLYREMARDDVLLPRFREFMQLQTQVINVPEALDLLEAWMEPEKPRPQGSGASETGSHCCRIAELALCQLRQRQPQHPLCEWTLCRRTPPARTLWPHHCVPPILDAINAVMYHLEDGEWTGYSAAVDQVLCDRWSSVPSVLLALYSGAAARLGVILHQIQFPDSYLLRYHTGSGDDCLFIDVRHSGQRQSQEEISQSPYLRIRNFHPDWFQPITRRQLLSRLLEGAVQTSPRSLPLSDADLLSVDELISWTEHGCCMDAHLLWRLLQIHGSSRPLRSIRLIQECVQTMGSSLPREEAERLENMKKLMSKHYEILISELKRHREESRRQKAPVQRRFRVGDIVRHRRYGYLATITGWTAACNASEHWIDQMGVDRLPLGRHQPFFNVLGDDNSNRYAADENLELAEDPEPIRHREIGRYFSRYGRLRYQPVEGLQVRYPDPCGENASRGEDAAPGGASDGGDVTTAACSSSASTSASASTGSSVDAESSSAEPDISDETNSQVK